jgi:hypothetical protein
MTIDYFSAPGINWSTLRYMRISPLAYRYACDNPMRDRTALMKGRAVHTLTLEPDRFAAEYAVYTGSRRAGGEWLEFAKANANKTILKRDEYDLCMQMAEAVRANWVAAELINGGIIERPICWTDPTTGLLCKAKPDIVTDDAVIDLKTTTNIDGRVFGALAARMGYHQQLAHYDEGVRAIYRGKRRRRIIIAVETKPPHDVGVFEIGPDDCYAADCDVAELLTKVKACFDAKRWPGRYGDIQALQIPAWATATDDDVESLGLNVQEG